MYNTYPHMNESDNIFDNKKGNKIADSLEILKFSTLVRAPFADTILNKFLISSNPSYPF